MLKKATRKTDVVDVPADNPEGTMDRFTAGLRRVLSAKKRSKPQRTMRRRGGASNR